ncbi:MAG: ABC transporter substrate-binding protein [Desulfobacterales bacterium]|nr:ABC transporter substrate-binding protein [Desulfobacterales bacterium]
MKSWKVLLCSMFVFAFVAWTAVASADEIGIGFTGPLSGPAAEYGQDCYNGVDMAVNEINAAGGVKVQGKKYTFKLEKLDDRADPTLAKNNAIRFVSQNKAIAVFNPVATTIGAIMAIPEQNFIIAAFSSVHTIMDKKHPMIINPVPNFVAYAKNFSIVAWDKGWRNGAMVVTLGAYGDAWRTVFKAVWEKKGGKILADKPANYYTETDFSAQLTAAIATKPDFLVVGGPSAPSALVIEQARSLGFKGGFVLIDQAKPDYIAKTLGNMKLLEGMISTGDIKALPLPIMPAYSKKYNAAYKGSVVNAENCLELQHDAHHRPRHYRGAIAGCQGCSPEHRQSSADRRR